MCGETVVYASVGAESVGGVTEDAQGFRGVCAYVCEDGCPEFEDAVHECDGSIVRGVVRVFFVGLVYECGGTGAPGCGGVAESGHDGEGSVDKIVGLVGEEFDDLVEDCIRSGGFAYGHSVNRFVVVVFCEVVCEGVLGVRLCRRGVVVVVWVRVVGVFPWRERESVGSDPLVFGVEVFMYGLDYLFRGGVNDAGVWVSD